MLPAVGDRQNAALDLENPSGDASRVLAAQPHDERRDVGGIVGVEPGFGHLHTLTENLFGHTRYGLTVRSRSR